GTTLQGCGVVEGRDPHDEPGLPLTRIWWRPDEGVVDARVVTGAAASDPSADHTERTNLKAKALTQQWQQIAYVERIFGVSRRGPGEYRWCMRLPEQLPRGGRDAILVSDPAAGAIIDHRERLNPLDRSTTTAPQR